MAMRWVDQARIYPARCAVLPHVGGRHELGYIDTGVTTTSGERVYVSVIAAQAMAEGLGYQRRGDVPASRAEIKGLSEQVAALTEERDSLARQLDAVHVLKREGFRSERKPGRKVAA